MPLHIYIYIYISASIYAYPTTGFLTLEVSQYTVTCLRIFSSDLGFYKMCCPWWDAYGTISTSEFASVAPSPRNELKILHDSMALAEIDQKSF